VPKGAIALGDGMDICPCRLLDTKTDLFQNQTLNTKCANSLSKRA